MRQFLRSKLFRIKATELQSTYDGSIAIGQVVMREAKIAPFERVLINNQRNGKSWTTYAIPDPDPGVCSLRGGAVAGLDAKVGDPLVILTFQEARHAREIDRPIVLKFGVGNRIHSVTRPDFDLELMV